MDLVAVLECGDSVFVSTVKSFLDQVGIPYLVQNENPRGIFGTGPAYFSNSTITSITIKVQRQDAQEAREIIRQLNNEYNKEGEE